MKSEPCYACGGPAWLELDVEYRTTTQHKLCKRCALSRYDRRPTLVRAPYWSPYDR